MKKLAALIFFLALVCAGCSSSVSVGQLGAVSAPPEDYAGEADGFRYQRSQLTDRERYLYDQLVAGIREQAEEIPDLYPDTEAIQTAAAAIYRDYPEFFWYAGTGQIETTQFAGKSLSSVFQPSYTMDKDQRERCQAIIDQWAADCFASLPADASDYDKVKGVYDYIIAHADYQIADSNSIVNIMVEGHGLCGCYAKTTQYLLNLLGVDCTYIMGQSHGESHAWNLVWLDGSPTWVDTTWGDSSPAGQETSGPSYEYLCMTTDDLLRGHVIDDTVSVPVCTDESYSYYRRNGLYFDTYDPDAIADVVARLISQGADPVSLRFASSVYPSAANTLFQKGEVRTILRQAASQAGVTLATDGSLWYTRNDEMSAITLTIPYS
jgi:hypothetical protein